MADPAFRGFVESTLDALLIFEGCKRGFLPMITRRLQEFEKRALVVSGAVFVFDEEETGIKRWTDGLSWSPSRTLGNFLVYRELDKKAQLPSVIGGACVAAGDDDDGDGAGGTGHVRSRLMGGLTSKADPVDEQDALTGGPVASGSGTRPGSSSARQRTGGDAAALDRARERALVGSLTSSYRFRSDGLVKKTISLQGLHLIGYYRIDDVVSGRLRTPSSHHELASIEVSPHFLAPSLYRVPPLVDVGADGQLKYRGEADAPMSPLTRSGSSQGFPTPGLSQSRPASSSNAPEAFGAVLPPAGGSWDYTTPAAPGSPRRSVTAGFRTSNRFDPYSSARFSPTHNYPPHTAVSYPFPPIPSNQPSPRTACPPIGETAFEGGSGDFYQIRTPPVDPVVSSSAPLANGGWAGAPTYQLSPPHGAGEYRSDGLPTPGPAFYQPRHSIPYAPTHDTSSSNAIFAYNPPPQPPGQAMHAPQYRAPHTTTGVYQSYQTLSPSGAPHQHALSQMHLSAPGSAPGYPPQLSPTSDAQSLSPFATPPSTAHAARAPHPGVQNLSHSSSNAPSHGNSLHSSPILPHGGYPAHARANGTVAEATRSLASQTASIMAEVSPQSPADGLGNSRMQHQQHQALRSMYTGGGYAAQPNAYRQYDQGSTPYGYSHHPPSSQHQASGLVAAIATEEVVPASGHGLGVSAYGEIVPASQADSSVSSASYAPLGTLRHPPPALPSVSLSAQHGYAQAPVPRSLYEGSTGAGGRGAGGHGSPLPSHLAGVLDRDAGGRATWPQKRDAPDAHVLQQPLSPPMQPRRTPVLAHPPAQQQQQQQQHGGQTWWGGEHPWQQSASARQPKEEYPTT
ncbi:hypothetical protein JCM3770_005780 [Rhodotorula araucariae]